MYRACTAQHACCSRHQHRGGAHNMIIFYVIIHDVKTMKTCNIDLRPRSPSASIRGHACVCRAWLVVAHHHIIYIRSNTWHSVCVLDNLLKCQRCNRHAHHVTSQMMQLRSRPSQVLLHTHFCTRCSLALGKPLAIPFHERDCGQLHSLHTSELHYHQ